MLTLDNLTGKYIRYYTRGDLYIIHACHDEKYVYIEALTVFDDIDDILDITYSSLCVQCKDLLKEPIGFFQDCIDRGFIYEITKDDLRVKLKSALLKWYNEVDRVLDSVVSQSSTLNTLEQQDNQQDEVEQKENRAIIAI